jgi:hypothetical protein
VELNRRDKPSLATIRGMARSRHSVYANDTMPRWVAVFGLQWQVIESHRLEPATDLYGAMTAAISFWRCAGMNCSEISGACARQLRRGGFIDATAAAHSGVSGL